MDTKLTLKLDKFVIEQAKEYASSHKRSLSRIIESYLRSLINRDKSDNESDFEISSFVKSMSTGINIPADMNAVISATRIKLIAVVKKFLFIPINLAITDADIPSTIPKSISKNRDDVTFSLNRGLSLKLAGNLPV